MARALSGTTPAVDAEIVRQLHNFDPQENQDALQRYWNLLLNPPSRTGARTSGIFAGKAASEPQPYQRAITASFLKPAQQ